VNAQSWLADVLKVRDIVQRAHTHHAARDSANAHLHLAEHVRYSPLTTELAAAHERLENLAIDIEHSGLI